MVRVGAIRWDGYNTGAVGTDTQTYLSPAQWHYRLPFWGSEPTSSSVVTNDAATAAVMNREIDMALACGIDYWCFCWYRLTPPQPVGMRDAYDLFMAADKKGLKYTLILFCDTTIGAATDWNSICDDIIGRMQDPAWMRTPSGQPILYIYYPSTLIPTFFGSTAAGVAGISTLRSRAAAAGLSSLYLIGMDGTNGVSTFGLDAGGRYAHAIPGGPSEYEVSYATLTTQAQNDWATIASTNQVVPLCSMGWDNRPRWVTVPTLHEPAHGPWATYSTPAQVASHIQAAISYVNANPGQCPANMILIYAWNEIDEGGWLVPHKGDGGGRLQSIAATIGRQRDNRRALRARGIVKTSR